MGFIYSKIRVCSSTHAVDELFCIKKDVCWSFDTLVVDVADGESDEK